MSDLNDPITNPITEVTPEKAAPASTFLDRIKKAFSGDMKWARVPYVLIILTIVYLMFSKGIVPFYEDAARDVRDALIEKDVVVEEGIKNMLFEGPEAYQIKEQYKITKELKDAYMMIAFHYSVYNYGFSIFFTIFSVITGILGFLIAKKGWDNSQNFYLRSSFLLSFFFSSLFGILPGVMNNEENIKTNLGMFHKLSGLQLDLYTLAKDNKGYCKANTKESMIALNKEILMITAMIKEYENLYFDIKLEAVSQDFNPIQTQPEN